MSSAPHPTFPYLNIVRLSPRQCPPGSRYPSKRENPLQKTELPGKRHLSLRLVRLSFGEHTLSQVLVARAVRSIKRCSCMVVCRSESRGSSSEEVRCPSCLRGFMGVYMPVGTQERSASNGIHETVRPVDIRFKVCKSHALD